MRGICPLSRRWHQQFFRSARFTTHQSCFQKFYPVRNYRRTSKGRPLPSQQAAQSGRSEIHEFEQFKDNRISSELIGKDVLAQEKENVEQELRKLDDELQVLRQGPFGPQSQLMRSLSVAERESLLKTLEGQGISTNDGEDLLTDEDLEDFDDLEETQNHTTSQSGTLRVQLRVPLKDKAYVNRFNKALEAAQSNSEDRIPHLNLWKWYLRCQQHVPNFSRVISEDVWRLLWNSQSKFFPQSKHIILLAKDMIAADVEVEPDQLVDYIHALHVNEDTATAVGLWEQERLNLGTYSSSPPRFWELGVDLYASLGRPQKAQDVAFEAFEHNPETGAHVFSTIVSAWAGSQHPQAAEKLWYCYLQMRSCLMEHGPDNRNLKAKLDDSNLKSILGRISSALLKAGRREMALSVFRDAAVVHGQAAPDSWEVYKDTLTGFKDLHQSTIHEDDINRIGLAALVTFPKHFQNKFFFGSWIKWLIGEGRVEDAALVAELMQERGVRPDAKHLNGIIGAWFRNGSNASRDKAERFAWAMIHSRIDQVNSRMNTGESDIASLKQSSGETSPYTDKKKLPHFLRRHIPPATIETFSLLLLQYTRRSELTKAEYLTEVLCGPAQLKPNVYIMNHWLYASLRSSDLVAVWNRYNSLKEEIQPDLETFTVLWDSAKANADWFGGNHRKEFPSPRSLFREMREWQKKLDDTHFAEMKSSFDRDLYEQIIRCFCLSSDLRGIFCVLRGLRVYFHLLPHEDVARMIIMQVARVLPSKNSLSSKPRKPGFVRRDTRYHSSLRAVAEIFESVTEKNSSREFNRGAEPEVIDDPHSEVAKQIRLDSLCDLLLMILERHLKPNPVVHNDIENQISTVATSMDVGREHLFPIDPDQEDEKQ